MRKGALLIIVGLITATAGPFARGHPVAGHVILGTLRPIEGATGEDASFTFVGATPTTTAFNGVIVESNARLPLDPLSVTNARVWTINCLWIEAVPSNPLAHIAYVSLAAAGQQQYWVVVDGGPGATSDFWYQALSSGSGTCSTSAGTLTSVSSTVAIVP